MIQFGNCLKAKMLLPGYKLLSFNKIVTIERKVFFLVLFVYYTIFSYSPENMDRLFATDGIARDIFRSVIN